MNDQIHVAESQHWYSRDGQPVYTVKSADGRDIAPDIRHARKLKLVPGFSGVSRVLSAPALERYKQEQAILAALTLTRMPGEDDKTFLARVREDAASHAKQRAEEGTAVHKAIEQSLRGEPFDPEWGRHVANVRDELGKLSRPFLGDFKTKPFLEGKSDKDLFFDENIMQLSAYSAGLNDTPLKIKLSREYDSELTFASPLGYGGRIDVTYLTVGELALVSILIGVKEAAVRVKVWEPEEIKRGLELFYHALAVWKLRNHYDSGWTPRSCGSMSAGG